ncbi:hypothetical protein Q4610_10510 [Sphingobium sp. HBC34]|uniref:Uncharacterized protein n=1 Tax=Sphingobium cyanobacteriorum TaxID=3063954 RepID=A0ABT8ZLP5_9SPHN|nr:hypothetical protein [Sphingobium sp. HBC34]MDO7835472.1 hypothetical protein [Sphingobium sp. HBC34]
MHVPVRFPLLSGTMPFTSRAWAAKGEPRPVSEAPIIVTGVGICLGAGVGTGIDSSGQAPGTATGLALARRDTPLSNSIIDRHLIRGQAHDASPHPVLAPLRAEH